VGGALRDPKSPKFWSPLVWKTGNVGNLTAVREMLGFYLKSVKCQERKSCQGKVA